MMDAEEFFIFIFYFICGRWRWMMMMDGCFLNLNFGVWLPDDWPGKVIQGFIYLFLFVKDGDGLLTDDDGWMVDNG